MSPDPESSLNMRAVDSLSSDFRALVHEFGLVIVAKMINDGYENAQELRGLLETWRERRQQQWLTTDYVTAKTAQSFSDASREVF